ncbi:MAG TPA: phage baseplate assembly protein V [Thermoanaerobaculia bacterium]|jgi:uncharacterized protein involved in type VI secretion and phage assembly
MSGTGLLDRTAAVPWTSCHLAEVVAVKDPEALSRVQVRLLAFDGLAGQDAPVWARVAVPFAGNDRGAFLIPDVGDEVLVTFVNADPRLPVVVGGLWNGAAPAPEVLGGDGSRVDRWTLVGKAGTRIAIVEERPGQAAISLTTPGGVKALLTDEGGGKIELEAAGTTITVDTSGVAVQTGGKVQVQASQVDVTAGQVSVNAAMSSFSGVVRCDVMQATTVIATTYTPGAGNVW